MPFPFSNLHFLWQDKLRFAPELDLPNDVVGLEDHIKSVDEMLNGTERLGIIGMGGIGKSTLAKVLFDSISGRFEYACFVHTVKLAMTKEKQLSDLRSIVIENLFWKGRKFSLSFDWTTLRMKKVLIILDGAECETQVNVMTERDGFAAESRVIVTARDRGFLSPLDFEFYMAQGLSPDYSRELFCLHAFRKKVAPSSHMEQVEKFAKKCDGLPLALKVAGRYLYSRKKNTWDDAFAKLGEKCSVPFEKSVLLCCF
jgi:hypothetical protein